MQSSSIHATLCRGSWVGLWNFLRCVRLLRVFVVVHRLIFGVVQWLMSVVCASQAHIEGETLKKHYKLLKVLSKDVLSPFVNALEDPDVEIKEAHDGALANFKTIVCVSISVMMQTVMLREQARRFDWQFVIREFRMRTTRKMKDRALIVDIMPHADRFGMAATPIESDEKRDEKKLMKWKPGVTGRATDLYYLFGMPGLCFDTIPVNRDLVMAPPGRLSQIQRGCRQIAICLLAEPVRAWGKFLTNINNAIRPRAIDSVWLWDTADGYTEEDILEFVNANEDETTGLKHFVPILESYTVCHFSA